MQNWYVKMSKPFPVNPSQEWTSIWTKTIPHLALSYQNVMYAMLSQSATNLLRDYPGDASLFAARQNYLILAMREQRKIVADLSLDKADPICLASILILVNSFAMMQERPLEPYTPPLDWIVMGRGAGTLIWACAQAMVKAGQDTSKSSLTMVITESYPYFGREAVSISRNCSISSRLSQKQSLSNPGSKALEQPQGFPADCQIR
jgi:hypothetical protein